MYHNSIVLGSEIISGLHAASETPFLAEISLPD
jgi:hypothetical protein